MKRTIFVPPRPTPFIFPPEYCLRSPVQVRYPENKVSVSPAFIYLFFFCAQQIVVHTMENLGNMSPLPLKMSRCELLEYQKANICIHGAEGTVSAHISHCSNQFIGLKKKKKKERRLLFPCPAAAGRGWNICPSEGGGGEPGLSGDAAQSKPIFSTKRGMT